MYYIVEFAPVEGRGYETAVIPDIWYSQEGWSYWPPYLSTTAAVMNAELPKPNWKKYSARILKGFGKAFKV
jgi:hypothetical protein